MNDHKQGLMMFFPTNHGCNNSNKGLLTATANKNRRPQLEPTRMNFGKMKGGDGRTEQPKRL